MRPFRALAAVTTAALSLVVAATSATPAAAAADCTLSVTNRVAIWRPYLELPAHVSGTCGQSQGSAFWSLVHPSAGLETYLLFDGTPNATYEVYSDSYIGTMRWTPEGAYDPSNTEVSQSTAYTTVKLAAGAWIASSRKGDVVTLTGTSLLYSTSKNIFFKRSASGVFQYRDLGTTQWKNLKALTTNSAGTASFSYRYAPQRDYRFALYSTPISWDLGSAVTRR